MADVRYLDENSEWTEPGDGSDDHLPLDGSGTMTGDLRLDGHERSITFTTPSMTSPETANAKVITFREVDATTNAVAVGGGGTTLIGGGEAARTIMDSPPGSLSTEDVYVVADRCVNLVSNAQDYGSDGHHQVRLRTDGKLYDDGGSPYMSRSDLASWMSSNFMTYVNSNLSEIKSALGIGW